MVFCSFLSGFCTCKLGLHMIGIEKVVVVVGRCGGESKGQGTCNLQQLVGQFTPAQIASPHPSSSEIHPWRCTPPIQPPLPGHSANTTHLLMLRILRTHNVHPPLPPHNTAPITHNLHTRPDLHPSGKRRRHCSGERVVDVLVLDMVGNLNRRLSQALEERTARGEEWSQHCRTVVNALKVAGAGSGRKWQHVIRYSGVCSLDCSGP
jgi:hypothetical protein